ncbi:MAG: MoaD/ThiS family protein [Bacteroidales bacterium]|nr:MoaD/ThiS family protein [Bacteroidales bacterium]
MEKRTIKIICFAGLRKFFGSETSVLVESGVSYSKVIDELIVLNPEAAEILASSRIAVNEEFVQPGEIIKSENTLFLIPPSSGG